MIDRPLSHMTHQAGAPVGRRVRSLARVLVNPASALNATAWFTVITVVMTWPLARGLARDIPRDLGDSLLNCWILGWGADRLLRFLLGDLGALAGFWNANIFYPAPATLAYSEHLFAQVVQILPVYALTRNLVLCYNLLFLSSFVLSALGAYLLVRDLTGDGRAAVLAGCLFGFALYRVGHLAHLQVLSAQWMPFVLLGLRRHLDSGRLRPLAGGLLALIAQNLSCGYYLVFFAPFVPAYVLYEMWDRRRLGDVRLWARLLAGAAIVVLATWPFIQPHLELRRAGFPARTLGEVELYAADVLAYATASPSLHVWGDRMRAFTRHEGELFPGLVPVLFACACLGLHVRTLWHTARERPWPARRWRPLALALLVITALALLSALVILTGYGFRAGLGPISIRIMSLPRSLRIAGAAFLGLLALSARARAFVRGRSPSVVGFFAVALVAAFVLSLGPSVTVGETRLSDGAYLYLYKYVPGFDGLRVPARMGMLAALFLAVLSGLGAAALARASKGWRPVVWAASLVFLVEAAAAPIGVNIPFDVVGVQRPPAGIETGTRIPPLYRFLATLAPDAVIVELPLGEGAYDVRYMYYSTTHWRRLVNGYSGWFPPWYGRLKHDLTWPYDDQERSFQQLMALGPTHAVVHESVYRTADGPRVSEWLRFFGAIEVAAFGDARVFALKPVR